MNDGGAWFYYLFWFVVLLQVVSFIFQAVHLTKWTPKYHVVGKSTRTLYLPFVPILEITGYLLLTRLPVLPLLWILQPLPDVICSINCIALWVGASELKRDPEFGLEESWRFVGLGELAARIALEAIFAGLATWFYPWGWTGIVILLVLQLALRVGLFAAFPLRSHHGPQLERNKDTERIFRLCEIHNFPVTGLVPVNLNDVFYYRSMFKERIYINYKALKYPSELLVDVAHCLGSRTSLLQEAIPKILPELVRFLLSLYIYPNVAIHGLFGYSATFGEPIPYAAAFIMSHIMVGIVSTTLSPLKYWYTRRATYAADRFVTATGLGSQLAELLKSTETDYFTSCKPHEYISMPDAPLEARIDILLAESEC
ncbi:hypothetical protein PSACC_02588 [Paramicrosporidium saccamoebae]|uniref:Uncharacterized protein n=1 Tax=Paramicrosporidium saccamoebae TaxID=1246581 RepID=A0A2H9TIH4_9FUNG|nr:hypothetical protein PSACC_02588 [Paramicrosporidium saccamoebae]